MESEIGKGSSFCIYLPASNKAVKETKDDVSEISAIKAKILIMDDDPDVLNVLSKMLKTIGCKYETAADGTEAVRKYRKAMKSGGPFDAVILDLTVPGGMGGKETVQKLLVLDPGAKVIVSSGYSDDLVMSNYQDYGFKAEIAKPYEIANLQKTLIGALRD